MSEYRRPIRVHIQPDDVLCFLHIPKTGGLSLISLLDEQFPPEQIFPLHSLLPEQELTGYTPDQLARYRLIRGHFHFGPYDNVVYHHLARAPLLFAFLREPIARTISAYRHQIREKIIPETVTLEQFALDDTYYTNVVNRQARWLAYVVRRNIPKAPPVENLPDDVLLFLAKENLERLAFFGLTERYKESLQLMCYTFGWPQPAQVPHVNTAPSPFDLSTLEPELLDAIRARVAVDSALFEYATGLFEQRYQQMIEEVLTAYHTLTHPAPEPPATEASSFQHKVIRSVRRWIR